MSPDDCPQAQIVASALNIIPNIITKLTKLVCLHLKLFE